MISKEINVLDDAMRDAIVHFIKEEENASKIPQIRKNIVKQELLPLFSNTKLHDIDKDYILNLIETQSISAVDGYLRSVGHRLSGFSEELLMSGVPLLEILRSSLYSWLETILRFIYDSGGFLVP